MAKTGEHSVGHSVGHAGAIVEIVRGLDRMAALREQWMALEGACGDPDFFQSFAWSMHIAEVRLRLGDGRYEPLVGVARRAGAVVALWPLARVRQAGQFELRAIDDPFGQLATVLAKDREAGLDVVAGTIAIAKAERIVATACMERVIVGSVLHEGLAKLDAAVRNPVDAPFVACSAFDTFADFVKSRNKKTMKNHRNAMNRFGRAGQIDSILARGADETAAIGRTALDSREAWLKSTGRTAPAFRTAGFSDVLTGTSRWGLEQKRAAFELRLDGRSLAQQIGYIHGGRYYAYISGMDWSREDLRPGSVHLALVVEEVFKAGLAGMEMLTPASDYKMVWADDVHHLVDMVLPLSAGGRLKQAVWDGGLRPAVKAAYYVMPASCRRFLARWAHGAS